LCYNRYDTTVYALKGNNTQEFWCYDAAGDSWRQLADVPLGLSGRKVKGGAGLAFWRAAPDEDYVYALKGNKRNEFWAYHVQADSWTALPDVPLGLSNKGMGDGSCVTIGNGTVYALKGSYNEYFAYAPGSDSWQTLEPMPMYGVNGRRKKAKFGSSLAWASGVVFALKGGTSDLWCYYTEAGVWAALESMPRLPSGRYTKGGGALSYGTGLLWALKGNKTVEFWTYDPGARALALNPGGTGQGSRRAAGGAQGDCRFPAADCSLATGPNPARAGLATVKFSAPAGGGARLAVVDAAGRVVLERQLAGRQGSVTLDELGRGVYIVRLVGAGWRRMVRLTVF
jgi:hypothetical protein